MMAMLGETTLGELFTIVQAVAMVLATVLVWSLHRAFASGAGLQKILDRLADLEQGRAADRSEAAATAAQVTSLARDVHALPAVLRQEFLPLREADLRFNEGARERARIEGDVKNLWSIVGRLREALSTKDGE